MSIVGFIGLGRMGMPIATNPLKAGFQVVACDVDPSRPQELMRRGGIAGADPAETARQSDVFFHDHERQDPAQRGAGRCGRHRQPG